MTCVRDCKERAERGLGIYGIDKEEEGCGCEAKGKGQDRPGDVCGDATGCAFSYAEPSYFRLLESFQSREVPLESWMEMA